MINIIRFAIIEAVKALQIFCYMVTNLIEAVEKWEFDLRLLSN